jgi:hypothetical protein
VEVRYWKTVFKKGQSKRTDCVETQRAGISIKISTSTLYFPSLIFTRVSTRSSFFLFLVALPQAKNASAAAAASSDESKSSSKTEKAAVESTAATAKAATTSKTATSDLSASSSLRLPEGISAPDLVAWARLAPRFGSGSSAIALLRAYLDQQSREDGELAAFKLDAAVSEEMQRHRGLDEARNAGAAAAAEAVEEDEGAAEGQAGPVVKPSIGVRKQLEANMRFRLAGVSIVISVFLMVVIASLEWRSGQDYCCRIHSHPSACAPTHSYMCACAYSPLCIPQLCWMGLVTTTRVRSAKC